MTGRRAFLVALGGTVLGTAATAGCTAPVRRPPGGSGEGDAPPVSGEERPATESAPSRTEPAASGAGEPPAGDPVSEVLAEWFADADNYESPVDARAQSIVVVVVGAEGNGGYHAFDPPAIRVSSGTTVVWLWSGAGGDRNVVALDGSFRSPLVDQFGARFTHTFVGSRLVRYYSSPHRDEGMVGAVVVEDTVRA